jgi:hypothetical protein
MGNRANRRQPTRRRIVGAGAETYELTKIDVAEALIRTAVRLFFEGAHPVPTYSLASSAREILTTIGEKMGIETSVHFVAKQKGVPVGDVVRIIHEYARFFKHADRDPTAKITFHETDVDAVLISACRDFGKVAGGMPIEMQVFEVWRFALASRKISGAPLRQQAEMRRAVSRFPGIRTADRKTQKRLGLDVLRQVERNPALRMEITREVKLVSNT